MPELTRCAVDRVVAALALVVVASAAATARGLGRALEGATGIGKDVWVACGAVLGGVQRPGVGVDGEHAELRRPAIKCLVDRAAPPRQIVVVDVLQCR